MLLRHDDPLVDAAAAARRAGVSARQQSHRRTHRAADLRQGSRAGASRSSASRSGKRRRRSRSIGRNKAGMKRSAFASLSALMCAPSISSSSISTARWSIPGATSPTRRTRCSSRAARGRSPRSASGGWSATARRRSSRARSRRPASSAAGRARALSRDLRRAAAEAHAAVSAASRRCSTRSARARRSPC